MACGILDLVEALTAALDAKNSYTRGHSDRVADLASAIALEYGLSEREAEAIHIGGHLHDIGKIGVPDTIITKEGPLFHEEFEAMKLHPAIGDELLSKVPALAQFRGAVRHHHERWDGQGYPDGLAGEAIPLEARIICVADAFDAITSTRSYRKSQTADRAIDLILEALGSQFDPRVAQALMSLFLHGCMPASLSRVELFSIVLS
jgi:HD-GYP domain-containing protein (c-di-GMP phosphodiesterase class II)